MRVWLPVVRAGSGSDVFSERLADGLRAVGVDVRLDWFPLRYEFLPELLRARVPHGTDVIHANSWNACVFTGRGIPVVATVLHLVHDPAFAPYRSRAEALYHDMNIRWRERRALRRCDRVTAISHYVARTVEQFSGRRDVITIPNWVDISRYAPDTHVDAGVDQPFRLLLVGNQSRRKGADLLPRLVSELGDGFEIRCTGGLRNKVDDAHPGVHWLGRLDEADLIREYQSCDAVITLSRYEGFGYTALEGMACGKPVVAFRTSALSEVIEDGKTGLLVELEDILAFASACRRLRDDQGWSRSAGQRARRRAESVFGQSRSIEMYCDLYAEAIAQREHAEGRSA
jgi:glycosyltransferase involved in cell wall biosynthesis